jgi:hypothetical protein
LPAAVRGPQLLQLFRLFAADLRTEPICFPPWKWRSDRCPSFQLRFHRPGR